MDPFLGQVIGLAGFASRLRRLDEMSSILFWAARRTAGSEKYRLTDGRKGGGRGAVRN